jgi:tetraacyldisaccharide 4'-kinase
MRRILLFPFSLLYGIAVIFRNLCYDWRIFKVHKFKTPIISVGNLVAGGSGKTPFIEYLIKLISPEHRVATLSRGYGRKTKGFILVSETANASLIGDEPMLYHTKYKNVLVAIGEKRAEAIDKLINLQPKPDIILMDDAYQHRSVKPGLNILLLEFNSLFGTNFLLPAGNFREPFFYRNRADIFIVTKTPASLDEHKRRKAVRIINPAHQQRVWFSYVQYMDIKPAHHHAPVNFNIDKKTKILLLTGIANPLPLKAYVEKTFTLSRLLRFADHYDFNETDLKRIRKVFENISGEQKIIITTEKDYMRLMKENLKPIVETLPIYTLPIEIKFLHSDTEAVANAILEYVRKNTANHKQHSQHS